MASYSEMLNDAILAAYGKGLYMQPRPVRNHIQYVQNCLDHMEVIAAQNEDVVKLGRILVNSSIDQHSRLYTFENLCKVFLSTQYNTLISGGMSGTIDWEKDWRGSAAIVRPISDLSVEMTRVEFYQTPAVTLSGTWDYENQYTLHINIQDHHPCLAGRFC